MCAAEANKKRRAKEAAAAAAPPSIASAAPPRIAPTIAPTPAPFPMPTMGRPPYGMQDGPPLPHKILFLQARAAEHVRVAWTRLTLSTHNRVCRSRSRPLCSRLCSCSSRGSARYA